jgi:glycosyltransferase involved in cell wall biosynthesis
MLAIARKPKLAVVSPFLDKRHGTERRVVEWISRLTDAFEVHVYSQEVEDLDLEEITWHRIPKLPGPHLFNFLWWFAANHLRRAWDGRFRGLRYDLVFSPGINCLDAGVISVHIVFAQYLANLRDQLDLKRHSPLAWPTLLHRKLYYALIISLERRIYGRTDTPLVLIARRTQAELEKFYGRRDACPIVYLGLDHAMFNPERRLALRGNARKEIGIENGRFALLLVGNDWRNKGFPVLLNALACLRDLSIDLLLVSREKSAVLQDMAVAKGLDGRVKFLSPRADIDHYYAAADAYAGPSLEDTFAQPPAEAMACGLPVIVSSANGASEIITDGVDGLILQDPRDEKTLATMVRRLWEDSELRERLGQSAAVTARQFTWERNARDLRAIFEEILLRKASVHARTLSQEL